jgi:hypothetical protein
VASGGQEMLLDLGIRLVLEVWMVLNMLDEVGQQLCRLGSAVSCLDPCESRLDLISRGSPEDGVVRRIAAMV